MPILLSVIFWLLLYGTVALLVMIYVPLSFFIKNPKFIDRCTQFWAKTVLFLLKKILRIDHQLIGLQNIPDEPCIIACKHQSMWETIVFHLIFQNPSPSYIYKKELTKIPFYGWYVSKMPCIKIDRKSGAKGLKNMIKQGKHYLKKGHSIIIFPQGTRTPLGASTKDYPYQVGIAALYKACNVKVIPAALNSGEFWGKKLLIKKTGCIKLEFLPAIQPGLDKKEFMQVLEEKIEKKTTKLNQI